MLYDNNKTPCTNEGFATFFQKREKEIGVRIVSLLEKINGKAIILCGATHACLRNVERFSKNYLNHTFSQEIKIFYQQKGKNVFSFFSDAYEIYTLYYNYDKDYPLRRQNTLLEKQELKYSLKGKIYNKYEECICFLKFNGHSVPIINYLPSFYFDNDINKYTSENLIITSSDLGFDGYLMFPVFSEV